MGSYAIEVIAEIDVEASWIETLKAAATATLADQKTSLPAGLTLLVTDDAKLHELNLTYRGEDKATDVLSFTFEDPAGPEMAGYLGDIAISVDTARRQAQTAGHALLDELCLLTVHGTLHLLGFDHDHPAAEAAMWAAQNAILMSLAGQVPGLTGIILTGDS
jgi:probable rRNA maturation factor